MHSHLYSRAWEKHFTFDLMAIPYMNIFLVLKMVFQNHMKPSYYNSTFKYLAHVY